MLLALWSDFWQAPLNTWSNFLIDAPIGAEVTVMARGDGTPAAEWLRRTRTDAAIAGEWLVAVRAEGAPAAESLGTLRAAGAAGLELLLSALADATAAFEALGTAKSEGAAAIELLRRAQADAAAAFESGATAFADAAAGLELLRALRADGTAAIEVTTVPSVAAFAELVATGGPRVRVATMPRRFLIAVATPRIRIATTRPNTMAQSANDLSPPIDAGVEKETVGFDFGPTLGPGVTIVANPAPVLGCSVYSGTDNAPASRILSSPTIVASARTGAPQAQVNALFGTMVANVVYRLSCTVVTSDGQTLNLWTHWSAQNPT